MSGERDLRDAPLASEWMIFTTFPFSHNSCFGRSLFANWSRNAILVSARRNLENRNGLPVIDEPSALYRDASKIHSMRNQLFSPGPGFLNAILLYLERSPSDEINPLSLPLPLTSCIVEPSFSSLSPISICGTWCLQWDNLPYTDSEGHREPHA